MATIKDVAEAAGVSIGTVSNYVNNTKAVKTTTAVKIKSAIEELGYRQNILARSLKSQKCNDIGIILPNFHDPYYVQIFQGIEFAFQQSEFYLNLAFSYDKPEREMEIIESFLKKQLCGLIIIPSMPDNWKYYYHAIISKNKPMIVLDRAIENLETNFIHFNNDKTISFITKLLIDKGLTKLVLLTGPDEFLCEHLCIDGFIEAHKARLLTIQPDAQIFSSGSSKEESFKVTTELFKQNVPQGIVTTSENSATGIIEAMTFLGYSTHDIPVVTLGEEHWNKTTHSIASLSSIRPAMHMGGLAGDLLKEHIKSPIVNESRIIALDDKILYDEKQFDRLKCRNYASSIATGRSIKDKLCVMLLDTSQVHALTNLMKNFTKDNGIEIVPTIVPHHELYQEILYAQEVTKAHEGCDVFMFDNPWLYTLASSGVLANITEKIIHPSFDRSRFLTDSFDYFSKFDGSYYGLPFMYAPQILYYRKDLFNDGTIKNNYERTFKSPLRPPQTWKEFNAICEYFTEHTNSIAYGTSIPAAYPECLAPEFYMRIFGSGGQIFDKNNTVVLNNGNNLKAYIEMTKTIKYAKPSYGSTDDVDVVKEFLSGETAMLITYPSFLNESVDYHKPLKILDKIGFSQIPGQSPILGGWSLGINAKSKKKDSAFDFIKWACTDQTSDYFSLLGGFSAIESTYTNDELVKLYPWFPLYRATYKKTRPIIPPRKKNGEIVSQNMIDEIICKGLYDLFDEKGDIPTIIEHTQKQLESLLSV